MFLQKLNLSLHYTTWNIDKFIVYPASIFYFHNLDIHGIVKVVEGNIMVNSIKKGVGFS